MKTLDELEVGLNTYIASISVGYVPKAKDHRLHEIPRKYGWVREIIARGLAHYEAEVDAADVCVRCGVYSMFRPGRRRKGKWTCEDCLKPKQREKTTPAK